MYTIKPIETKYDGYRMRSRTEARYAVMFRACSLADDPKEMSNGQAMFETGRGHRRSCPREEVVRPTRRIKGRPLPIALRPQVLPLGNV